MVYDHYSARLSKLDAALIRHIRPGGNWRDLPLDFPSERVRQIREKRAKGGGSRSTYYGRLRWDRPAYTINTYFNRPGNGCFIHPAADRLITLREAARIQSFPDQYRFTGSLRSRHMQIGNAVPPLLAYHIASSLGTCGSTIDLFCGGGGLSLGFEWAGFHTTLAVDKDESALATFVMNRPNSDVIAANCDLATKEGVDRVVELVRQALGGGRPTIVMGGPPCQGYSTAGKCALDDPRNQLVFSFLTVVERLRPDVVLMENVPALLFRRHSNVLGEIRKRLAELGYHSAMTVAHAEAFGVPQLRRRLLLQATLLPEDIRWPQAQYSSVRPILSKYHHGKGLPHAPPLTVADAIDDLPLEEAKDASSGIEYSRESASAYQRLMRGSKALLQAGPGDQLEPLQQQLAFI